MPEIPTDLSLELYQLFDSTEESWIYLNLAE